MDMLMKDNDFMSVFLDMLRELPCLWEIKHPHFKNQAKGRAALEQLCEIVKQGSLSQEVAGPSRLADLQVPPLPLERESGRRRSALEEAARGLFWRATEVLGAPHTV
ncbi:hypothetical protein AB205_0099320 [Aquarana catesbeiana]|uniref:MADF domain-containing protein n=1 Tax=Aquarana catesbeiana TaxID=8400 RepID=A0A2G9Q512_AQUCT|nr:hypothetical protein AB205_0099320 [Aquarana catesbeiana]